MIVYTDASCQGWQNTNGSSKGIICLYVDNPKKVTIIKKELTIEDPTLKQFINRFELAAIEEAFRLFPSWEIRSDSKVAVKWAKDKGIPVEWVSREKNKAGVYLEFGVV